MKNKPLFSWMGGKRRLAKYILPNFPEHTTYVEPFAGAAALYFMKPQSKVEVINDVNSDLVNLYRVIQHHLEEFIRQFKWSLVSRQMFEWLDDTPPEVLTDIQRAARFFYLQKNCFGGKYHGRSFGANITRPPSFNLLRIEQDLSEAHLRLARTAVEHLDWRKCIEKYDRENTLFYLDPPYWKTAGYGVDFSWSDYQDLADAMASVKGKMILSINGHPDIRELFSEFRMDEYRLRHNVGGQGGPEASELVIYNW